MLPLVHAFEGEAVGAGAGGVFEDGVAGGDSAGGFDGVGAGVEPDAVDDRGCSQLERNFSRASLLMSVPVSLLSWRRYP